MSRDDVRVSGSRPGVPRGEPVKDRVEGCMYLDIHYRGLRPAQR
jgi:hypothetical protein